MRCLLPVFVQVHHIFQVRAVKVQGRERAYSCMSHPKTTLGIPKYHQPPVLQATSPTLLMASHHHNPMVLLPTGTPNHCHNSQATIQAIQATIPRANPLLLTRMLLLQRGITLISSRPSPTNPLPRDDKEGV